jgi:hypothetical protein
MTDSKLTKKEIKALEAQIKNDQEKPVRGNEKRLKLNISFTEAIDKIAKNIKPPRKPEKK